MKKGEIWVMTSENSNGHEQSGTRPAVLFSDVVARIVTVIPLTSNSRALRFAHTIQLSPTASTGLTAPSTALVFQLRAIDVKRLEKKIGVLTSDEIRLINVEVKKMLKL